MQLNTKNSILDCEDGVFLCRYMFIPLLHELAPEGSLAVGREASVDDGGDTRISLPVDFTTQVELGASDDEEVLLRIEAPGLTVVPAAADGLVG